MKVELVRSYLIGINTGCSYVKSDLNRMIFGWYDTLSYVRFYSGTKDIDCKTELDGTNEKESRKVERLSKSSLQEDQINEKMYEKRFIKKGLSVLDIPVIKKSTRKRTKLPVPPSMLLPGLVAAQLLNPIKFKGFTLARKSMNSEECYCEYHMGCLGHSTDNCFELYQDIQELIDRGLVNFQRKEVAPFWKKSKTRHKNQDKSETKDEPPIHHKNQDETSTVDTSDEPETVETKDEPETVEAKDEPETVETKDEPETVEAKDEPETVETSLNEPVKFHTSQNDSEDHSSKSFRIPIIRSRQINHIIKIFQTIVLTFIGIIAAYLFPYRAAGPPPSIGSNI